MKTRVNLLYAQMDALLESWSVIAWDDCLRLLRRAHEEIGARIEKLESVAPAEIPPRRPPWRARVAFRLLDAEHRRRPRG